MEAIDKLIGTIYDKMCEAIKEAKCDDSNTAYIELYMEDNSRIEIESECSDYYDVHFFSAPDDEEEKYLPNLLDAINKKLPDWDDVEVEGEYDEWNEHGFRDAADYYHWRYG